MMFDMLRNRMFKPPKHRYFEYQARYYDPVEEDLKKRVNAALQEKAMEEGKLGTKDEQAEYLKAKESQAFGNVRKQSPMQTSDQKMRSRMIFIAVLAFLTYIAYQFIYA